MLCGSFAGTLREFCGSFAGTLRQLRGSFAAALRELSGSITGALRVLFGTYSEYKIGQIRCFKRTIETNGQVVRLNVQERFVGGLAFKSMGRADERKINAAAERALEESEEESEDEESHYRDEDLEDLTKEDMDALDRAMHEMSASDADCPRFR